MQIKQRVSLIVGGAGGIGQAIVREFLSRGDRVFVFDCLDDCNENVLKLKESGCIYNKVNVSSLHETQNGFSLLQKKFDVDSLDILVNSAGITKDGLAIKISEEDWDSVLNINLKGLFFCCKQAIKIMMQKRRGYIINISSIAGLEGNSGQANYAASKGGVVAVTKTLAKEYAPRNILVNAIAPGFIETPMTNRLPDIFKQKVLERVGLKRFGSAEEVANLAEFLTSGRADYITGEVIRIDGGVC